MHVTQILYRNLDTNVSTPESERACKICNTGDVEDEQHFLSVCSKYSSERSQYIKKVSDYLNFDINLMNDYFLINCLNSNSYTILVIKLTIAYNYCSILFLNLSTCIYLYHMYKMMNLDILYTLGLCQL